MFDYCESLVSKAISGDVQSVFILLTGFVLSCAVGMAINRILHAIWLFFGLYPLHVFERLYRDCHATWLKGGGILLTSRATGQTVSKIQVSDVKSVLLQSGGLGGRLCLRFTYRLNEVQN